MSMISYTEQTRLESYQEIDPDGDLILILTQRPYTIEEKETATQ